MIISKIETERTQNIRRKKQDNDLNRIKKINREINQQTVTENEKNSSEAVLPAKKKWHQKTWVRAVAFVLAMTLILSELCSDHSGLVLCLLHRRISHWTFDDLCLIIREFKICIDLIRILAGQSSRYESDVFLFCKFAVFVACICAIYYDGLVVFCSMLRLALKIVAHEFIHAKPVQQSDHIGYAGVYDLESGHGFASGCDHQAVHTLDVLFKIHFACDDFREMFHLDLQKVYARSTFILIEALSESAERPVTEWLLLAARSVKSVLVAHIE